MEKHIEELRKKLYNLKNMTHEFSYGYNEPGYRIFLKEFGGIFDKYKFPDDSYLTSFNAVSFVGVKKTVEAIASKGSLSKEEAKERLDNKVKEYRELLDKMIHDINISGERDGERFIEIKKKEIAQDKESEYSKRIGLEKDK